MIFRLDDSTKIKRFNIREREREKKKLTIIIKNYYYIFRREKKLRKSIVFSSSVLKSPSAHGFSISLYYLRFLLLRYRSAKCLQVLIKFIFFFDLPNIGLLPSGPVRVSHFPYHFHVCPRRLISIPSSVRILLPKVLRFHYSIIFRIIPFDSSRKKKNEDFLVLFWYWPHVSDAYRIITPSLPRIIAVSFFLFFRPSLRF